MAVSNRYIAEFVKDINRRFAQDALDMDLAQYICANTTLDKRPFSFERYPFQEKIARDMHPNLDCIKPSQVGLTEVQIRKTICWLLRNRHTAAIFTLPNEKMFKRIATPRILPILDHDEAFNLGEKKPTRSQGMCEIGDSFLFITGAAESDATSISADMVMNDEIDLTDKGMLSLFNSRLQNSDHKINQRFSTPTFEGFGVDLGYQASDQHEYMCKCKACNHWQTPIFTRDYVHIPNLPDDIEDFAEITTEHLDKHRIDLNDTFVKCGKCGAPLDLGDYSAREWVPKYPSRTHARGYRVSPFSTHRLPPQYILQQLFKYKERDYLRGWYNTVLGLPHTGGDQRLSEAQIKFCMQRGMGRVPDLDPVRATWIGIDVGTTCYIVVGQDGATADDTQVIRWETCLADNLEQRVNELCAIYNVKQGCMDRFPYTPTANSIRDATKGTIIPVEYRGSKDINPVEEPAIEDSSIMMLSHIQANRTMFVDHTVGKVRGGTLPMSGWGNQETIIIEHLRDMVRDEQPDKEAQWVKLTGNDHYLHALCFMVYSKKVYAKLHSNPETDPRNTVFVGGLSPTTTGGPESLIGYDRTQKNLKGMIR